MKWSRSASNHVSGVRKGTAGLNLDETRLCPKDPAVTLMRVCLKELSCLATQREQHVMLGIIVQQTVLHSTDAAKQVVETAGSAAGLLSVVFKKEPMIRIIHGREGRQLMSEEWC